MQASSPILFVLHIAGAAALLIWSVRLVRTGVERGWSVPLRRLLRRGSNSRWLAALSGSGAAILLQSSTAVAILTANFVAAGTLAGAAGLAILLGADVGSAIVAQILLTRADWLVPLLLVSGVVMFLRASSREFRVLQSLKRASERDSLGPTLDVCARVQVIIGASHVKPARWRVFY